MALINFVCAPTIELCSYVAKWQAAAYIGPTVSMF